MLYAGFKVSVRVMCELLSCRYRKKGRIFFLFSSITPMVKQHFRLFWFWVRYLLCVSKCEAVAMRQGQPCSYPSYSRYLLIPSGGRMLTMTRYKGRTWEPVKWCIFSLPFILTNWSTYLTLPTPSYPLAAEQQYSVAPPPPLYGCHSSPDAVCAPTPAVHLKNPFARCAVQYTSPFYKQHY